MLRPSGDQSGSTPYFSVSSRVGPPLAETIVIWVPQLPFLANAICLPSGDQVGLPCSPVGHLIACAARCGARLARTQAVAPPARSTTIPAAIRISRRDIGGREGNLKAALGWAPAAARRGAAARPLSRPK